MCRSDPSVILPAMGEYTLDSDEDYLKFYVRQDDKMSIGEVPLMKLNYVFCEDKFMSMKTRMDGKHFIDMKQILTQQYGEPIQQNRYIPEFSWIDNNAFITFKNNTVGRYCDLTISSVREIINMDKVQKERAKKASGDF